MKVQVSYHNIDKSSHAELEKNINDLAERHVARRLMKLSADSAQLHAHLEKSSHRERYLVKLQLSMPGGSLASAEESANMAAAMRKAFAELERDLERHLARLRGEDAWRRIERRDIFRRLKKAMTDQPEIGSEAFGDLVRPLLPKLERFVRHELSYLRARGDLDPSFPTHQDIVDEVLARAYQKLNQRPAKVEPLHWLYQIAQEVLKEEVRHRRIEEGRFVSGRYVSLESKLPETPDETLDERDESIYEFLQPDEKLKVEDIVPVTDATPEEAASENEMRNYLHSLLAKLPTEWRRAVWLTQAEDMPVSKVAQMLGATEDQVRHWIEQADAFLRARLKEVGYSPTESGQNPPYYFAPAPATAAPELTQIFDQAIDEAVKSGKKGGN